MFYVLLQVLMFAVVTSAVFQHSMVLKNGNEIPEIAFGTLEKKNLVDKIKPTVIQAIESGYRHINTAAAYQNEEHIGEAIADVISRGVVTREELFITTKLLASNGAREAVVPAIRESLDKLKLYYVDLYLIHTPDNMFDVPRYDYVSVWKGMEDVKKLNLSRYIGVSNFNSTHINKILTTSNTIPAANEIEVNPTFANLELVAYCRSLNMTVMSYSPFGFMVPRPFASSKVNSTFEEPLLQQIAQKYGKMPSQVVLRYLIDRGVIPMPKSTNINNIKANIDVFGFQLTHKEVYEINELDRGVKVWYFHKEQTVENLKYYNL